MLENKEKIVEEKQPDITDEKEALPEREGKEVSESKYSQIELEAMKAGWKPKDQWDGDPNEHRSAKEFIERGEFFDRIHKLSYENKDIKKTLSNVQELMRHQAEHVRQQTIKELTQQKLEAMQSGDFERAENINDEIFKHRVEKIEPRENSQSNPDVQDWLEQNKSWFNDDTPENMEMRELAVKFENWLVNKHPGISAHESLAKTREHIIKKFPSQFENHRKYERSTVESNTPPVVKRKKYNPSAITDQTRQIAKDFVKKGVFKNEDAYYEELHNIGAL